MSRHVLTGRVTLRHADMRQRAAKKLKTRKKRRPDCDLVQALHIKKQKTRHSFHSGTKSALIGLEWLFLLGSGLGSGPEPKRPLEEKNTTKR